MHQSVDKAFNLGYVRRENATFNAQERIWRLLKIAFPTLAFISNPFSKV